MRKMLRRHDRGPEEWIWKSLRKLLKAVKYGGTAYGKFKRG